MQENYQTIGWQDGSVLQPAKVTVDNVEYNVTPVVKSGSTPTNATNLNHMDNGINQAFANTRYLNEHKIEKTVIELIAVTDTAPSECVEGDLYYNTTDGLIYEATGTDTWSQDGTPPVSTYLYADLDEEKLYYYDGTTFSPYGGGEDASLVDSLPVGSEIDFDGQASDIPVGWEETASANFCWAYMSSDYTIQAINTQETLPIDTVSKSSGSKLTVTTDGIVIGSGISAVTVSAQVYWYSNCADSEGVVYVYKNNQNLYVNNHRITDTYEHQAIATLTIPVVEGDIIRLKIKNDNKTALIKNYESGTFLIVTAIG